MPNYFRCSRTGMLYPDDYIEQWGKKYGIGLGSIPVSEALVNVYDSPLVRNPEVPEQTMYPVATCRAQVDFCTMTEDEAKSKLAVLAIDDPHMEVRSEIMRGRQREHSAEMARIYRESIGV